MKINKIADANEIAKIIIHIIWPFSNQYQAVVSDFDLNEVNKLVRSYLEKKINKTQFFDILVNYKKGEINDLNIYIQKLNSVDDNTLYDLFDEFVRDNPKQVEMYKKPEKKLAVANFFVGFAKRKLHGGGDVGQLKEILDLGMKKM
jgi:Asp-tRNA(Asn)/Glu-tRNA(Gln) amidotransferase B subunit